MNRYLDNLAPPVNPEFKFLVDILTTYMRERNLDPRAFSRLVWGLKPSGEARGNIYPYLKGSSLMTEPTARHVAAKTGLKFEDLYRGSPYVQAQRYKRTKPSKLTKKNKAAVVKALAVKPPTTPVRAALAEYEDAGGVNQTRAYTKKGPPLFAMSIEQDGTANVTYNLQAGSITDALAALHALQGASLIRVNPEG